VAGWSCRKEEITFSFIYVHIQLVDLKEFVPENTLKKFARKSGFQNVSTLCEYNSVSSVT
jgi:hypothetical protein